MERQGIKGMKSNHTVNARPPWEDGEMFPDPTFVKKEKKANDTTSNPPARVVGDAGGAPHSKKVSPPHYRGRGGLEVIEFIDSFDLDLYQGSIVQYIVRYKKKNGLEDLLKAQWYLNRLIEKTKRDGSDTK